MLVTLIRRYDKNHLISRTEVLQAARCHILYFINTIYQFIKPFLDNKMSIFEEYGAFKENRCSFRDWATVKFVFSFLQNKGGCVF